MKFSLPTLFFIISGMPIIQGHASPDSLHDDLHVQVLDDERQDKLEGGSDHHDTIVVSNLRGADILQENESLAMTSNRELQCSTTDCRQDDPCKNDKGQSNGKCDYCLGGNAGTACKDNGGGTVGVSNCPGNYMDLGKKINVDLTCPNWGEPRLLYVDVGDFDNAGTDNEVEFYVFNGVNKKYAHTLSEMRRRQRYVFQLGPEKGDCYTYMIPQLFIRVGANVKNSDRLRLGALAIYSSLRSASEKFDRRIDCFSATGRFKATNFDGKCGKNRGNDFRNCILLAPGRTYKITAAENSGDGMSVELLTSKFKPPKIKVRADEDPLADMDEKDGVELGGIVGFIIVALFIVTIAGSVIFCVWKGRKGPSTTTNPKASEEKTETMVTSTSDADVVVDVDEETEGVGATASDEEKDGVGATASAVC